MKSIKIFSLIKIGQKNYMEDLLNNGTIYMNHISEFVKIEDGNLRGDKCESMIENIDIFNLTISHEGKEILKADIGSLQTWEEQPIGNIYSMYMLETVDDVTKLYIDSRCKEFGDTAVIILDVREFVRRFEKAIESMGLKLYKGPVEYVDTAEFRGKWSLFKKPINYKYQSEFRFVVKRENNGPLIMRLGSLMDIARVIESDKLEMLKFSKS